MLHIKQLVPTVAVTLATATLVTPAAQARPTDAPVGSSPQSLSTHAFSSVHRGPGPGLSSSQPNLPHWGSGTFGRDVTVVRAQPQNSPLKNQLSIPVSAQNAVAVPATDSGFDWTAAAMGAIVASLLGLMVAAGLNLRTRITGHLAA
jgi:hypothetical protein